MRVRRALELYPGRIVEDTGFSEDGGMTHLAEPSANYVNCCSTLVLTLFTKISVVFPLLLRPVSQNQEGCNGEAVLHWFYFFPGVRQIRDVLTHKDLGG